MKTIVILLLFFCNSLQAQTSKVNQASDKQFNNFKSYQDNMSYKDGFKIVQDSVGTDFLNYVALIGRGGGFGRTVSYAGDVNGDGYDDVIVGTNGYQKAYIYYGGIILDSIADVIFSGAPSFAFSVSGIKDVNGDGFDDIIIGEQSYSTEYEHGRAFIYFGGNNMDNIPDLILKINDPYGRNFGSSVASAGDVNGDGFPDVLVADGGYAGGYSRGRVYIFYGNTNMDIIPDVNFNSTLIIGSSISAAGDLNGDGFDDVIIAGESSTSNAIGTVLIYYGAQHMSNYPRYTFDCYCTSVSGAGDVNGDGYDDVIIGEQNRNNYTAKADILFGGVNMDVVPDVIFYSNYSNTYLVSNAGDLNRDGFDDVIIGSEGKADVYYGGTSMNNNPDYTLNHESSSGKCVSSAGDVNNDGFDDVIIGASSYEAGKGKAYVYFNSILIAPQDNSSLNPQLINFKWKKVNSVVSYNLQISADSTFNNLFVNYTTTIDTFKTVSGFQKDTKYFWRVITNDTLGSQYYSAVWNFRIEPPLISSLKILMEGMYYPLFNIMSRKDTVKVFLHQITSPYNLIDSSKSTIDSLTFKDIFKFYNAPPGTYYLAIKHFNSIETWSKSGGVTIVLSDTTNYDFTTAKSQAYMSNLIKKGSRYCLFGGDVNQDGIIDATDVSKVDNDSYIGIIGRFLTSDVTGDNYVDAQDVSLVDNNSFNSIIRIRPWKLYCLLKIIDKSFNNKYLWKS